ncbi:hypothetical protein [Lutibacter sp.]
MKQTFCYTPNHSNYQYLNTMMRSSSLSDESYCIKIYFHVIRRTDGTGGQNIGSVNQAFQILNNDYNPHDISFVWDGNINYIDNDTFYNNPSYGGTLTTPPAILGRNNHLDGIDIYLFDNNAPSGGLANGVGESSEFYVSGSYWKPPYQSLITSHVISHEMGHVLFLWHTHHGTNEGGNDNPCAELVDGSNSTTCGDYVVDTPADPHIHFNVDTNCQWTASGTDANGVSYSPDTHNIMAYTSPDCMSYITELQGLRAKNAIATLPYLQQTLTNCCEGNTLNLYIKDRPDDTGIEPNPTPDVMWISQDIWIRNFDDGGLTHQNPEYNANGNHNYINVRVINKSCVASTGNETLTINWAKANTALAWPQNWDGSMTDNDDGNGDPFDGGGDPLGGELSSVTIPVIQPGDEAIIKVPWVVPNPNDYSDNTRPWHFCLLAQIDDGNPVTMTTNPNVMVRNENNLAWKNVTVVDLVTNLTIASVMIANPTNNTKTYYLELIKDNNENGKAVYEEAEVTLKMDETLFNAWERGGKIAQEVEAKQDEKEKLVKGNNVLLDNINFNANEMGLLTLDFKFLTKQVTDKEEFTYHVIQKDAQTGEIIGGETFVIRKKQRSLFVANADDDKEVDLNEMITITAEDINEVAEYNWYDSEGNLIYQGKDLSVSADITKKYKLEVITADGFKDYDEVEVKLRPGYIQTISPNPSSNSINVDYKLNGATSAYLMVIGVNNNSSNNYILDTSTNSITIDISSYQTGNYTLAIVCDGQVTDAKQLLKQ